MESVVALHRGESRCFSSIWRAGVSYFWRVLRLKVLLLLISLGLLIMIATPVALAFWAVFFDLRFSLGPHHFYFLGTAFG